MTMSNIATAINAAHDKAETAKREGTLYAMEAGRLLIEAKATVAHGGWDDWLKVNVKFSPRTARLYMQAYRYVGSDPAKRQRVADMSLREIDRELSAETAAKSKPSRGKGYTFTADEKEICAISLADAVYRWVPNDDDAIEDFKRLLRDAGYSDLAAVITARRGIPDAMRVDLRPRMLSPQAQAEIDRLMGRKG